MKIIQEVPLSKVRTLEKIREANFCLGGYDMKVKDDEWKCYRGVLEDSDLDRLFLLNELDFGQFTNNTHLLKNLLEGARNLERVQSFIAKSFDLRIHRDYEPILVTINKEKASLIAIDGNHRLMSHYLQYKSIFEVPVYIGEHDTIIKSGHIPFSAK